MNNNFPGMDAFRNGFLNTLLRFGRSLLLPLLIASGLVAQQAAAVPTVNGLFFGDDDYLEYLLLQNDTSGGSRGKLYYYLDGNTLYIALVASKTVNDNVCGISGKPNQPGADQQYMKTSCWNNGSSLGTLSGPTSPGGPSQSVNFSTLCSGYSGTSHECGKLTDSDHAEFVVSCGHPNEIAVPSPPSPSPTGFPFWIDLVDAPNVDHRYGGGTAANPLWTGNQLGADAAGNTTVPPGFVSMTSLAANLNTATWDVTLGGTRVGRNEWKTPDAGQLNWILDDYYQITDQTNKNNNWNPVYNWEWPLVYEFSFDISGCTTNIGINPGTSHNSPAKSGDENITFDPPPVITTYSTVNSFNVATNDAGQVVVNWETGSEIGTVGFHVERQNEEGKFRRVNHKILPGLLTAPQGGSYSLVDDGALPGNTYVYRLVEVEAWGAEMAHGPYTVTVAGSGSPESEGVKRSGKASKKESSGAVSGFSSRAHPVKQRKGNGKDKQKVAKVRKPGHVDALGKVTVSEDGMVFVSAADVARIFNLSDKEAGKRLQQGKLRLTSQGKPVAWLYDSRRNGMLFYGKKLDSIYSGNNVYWLDHGKGNGIASTSGKPGSGDAATVTDSLTFEQDRFAATVVARDPEADNWFWAAAFGGVPPWDRSDLVIEVPDVVQGLELTVGVKGATTGSHPVELYLNGVVIGSTTGQGVSEFMVSGPIPAGALVSGSNTVSVVGLAGEGNNIFYTDHVTVSYTRNARAVGGKLLVKGADGDVAVSGFSQGDVNVFDVTDPHNPLHLSGIKVDNNGSAGYTARFAGSSDRHYLVAGSSAVTTAVPDPYLAPKWNGKSDYVVVTVDELQDAARSLADYRQANGLSSRVVTVNDIYAQFSNGIETPHAVKAFLLWAQERWGTRYAVMAGEASIDYRGVLVPGENMVPTMFTATPYGIFACDSCLADADNDGVPNFALSRIPASDAAGLTGYVDKLKRYEQGQSSPLTDRIGMLAGAREELAGDFPVDSERIINSMPATMQGNVSRIYRSEHDPATANAMTIDLINSGVGWINHLGHGGSNQLQDFLYSHDLGSLVNSSHLPVVTAMTCAANRIEIPGYVSLGEDLVLHPNGGGIAVWSAAGQSYHGASRLLNETLFRVVFEEQNPVLGDAIVETLRRNKDSNLPFVLKVFNLQGDAALNLR